MSEWTPEAQRRFATLLKPVLEQSYRRAAMEGLLNGKSDDSDLARYRELADLFRLFVASIPRAERGKEAE
jgi:hypothetical protein